MYLAEFGKNGWSEVCESVAGASRAILARRAWLVEYGNVSEESVRYEQWAIWKDGEFVMGRWPVA